MARKAAVTSKRRTSAAGGTAPGEARIVAFVDIRGFTRKAEDEAGDPLLPALLFELFVDLQVLLNRTRWGRGKPYLKPLGDGAMLLVPGAAPGAGAALPRLLDVICEVETRLKERLAKARGDGTALRAPLGWGIAQGQVTPVHKPARRLRPAFAAGEADLDRALRGHAALDYFGPAINRAKRLCDRARPWGVCIDRASFAEAPTHPAFRFSARRLKDVRGIAAALPVWFAQVHPPREAAARDRSTRRSGQDRRKGTRR